MRKYLLSFLALALSMTVAFAQERTVSGKVTAEEDGSAVPGVNVVVKGTTSGTVTDVNGEFKLTVTGDGGSLLFSFIGFSTQEVVIGTQSVIDISLESDVTQLSEVVVTAVGIEANKASLGYSIENVKTDEIINAKETNLVNALNSKVAGVTVVSSSGSPGASANIRIRGNTSIGRTNSPLFVVDGVPIDNNESGNGVAGVDQSNRAIDINPNDIESLTVLKGPAATALYGIRAANGAIIITTKSGERGAPKVSFSTSYSADQINNFPELQETWAQGRPSGGAYTYRGPETFEGFSWGPRISELEFDGATDYPFDQNGRLVATGSGNGQAAQYYEPTDFFVTGNTFDNNVSVNGGTNVLKYFMSVGDLRQTGVVPNADFHRTSFRANLEAKLNDKLTAGISGAFTNSGGTRVQRGSNLSGVMLGLLRNTGTFDMGNGKTGQEAADDPATYILPDGSQRSYRAGIYDSPYWTANKNPFNDNVNRIIGNVSLRYEFNDWLSASYKLGIDTYTDERVQAEDINRSFAGNLWDEGYVTQSTRTSNDVNHDFLFLINTPLGDDFNLNGTLGYNYWKTKYTTKSATGSTLAAPDFYNISNATDIVASEAISQKELVGVFASLNFGWRDQVFLNYSARNDWSSTLPKENNSFLYQAVSAAWSFTEAFDLGTALPYGKLRASWGQVGNDAPIYATQSYFNSALSDGDGFIGGTNFPAFGVNAFERSTTLGNDKLLPETTTTIEVGAELKFLEGKLGLDVTWYDAETTDQIISVVVPASTGFTSTIQNAGIISNTGWEVMFNWNVLETSGFRWDMDINWTKYETTVDELAPGVEQIFLAGFTSTSSRVLAGKPYGAIYGSGYATDDAGQTLIDPNGYPIQDSEEGFRGDPNPDWVGGWRNTFSWNGISLSALLDFRQGGEMWCGTCGIINYFGRSQLTENLRTETVVFDGVLADGSTNNIEVPYADPANGLGAIYWVRYGFGGLSSESIFDTSWVRLRELTLGYQFPQTLMDSWKITSMRIQLTGRNLWLSTDYPGVDPETNLTGASNGFGLDYFNMPNTKSYSATLSITF